MREIPRIKFENGKVVIDVFTAGNPTPIFHLKGSLKEKRVRDGIKLLKEKFGNAFFSDIIDFVNLSERSLKERMKEDFNNFEELKKQFEEISKKNG